MTIRVWAFVALLVLGGCAKGHVVVNCPTCHGTGKAKCGGALEVTCARCSGSGKIQSETKGGLSNHHHKDWD